MICTIVRDLAADEVSERSSPPTGITARRARPQPDHEAVRASWTIALDAVIVVALLLVAYLVRRDGLPRDGLWFDDSWVAAGAVRGTISNLMTVSSGQPGFSAGLMVWSRITDGDIRTLAYPAMVAGTIGPSAIYLALRRMGYATSIAGLLGAALVVSEIHILYSTRVKTYTTDVLLVLSLAVVLPRLARARWRWVGAAAWASVAIAVSAMSGFVLVATASTGIILFLHPKGDRVQRGVAVAVQAVGSLVLFEWARRSSNLASLEADEASTADGHIKFSANPIRYLSEIFDHLRRIATVYPGGSGRWLTPIVLAAFAGLVAAALSRRRRGEPLRARLLLLITLIGLAGAMAGKLPFGTTTSLRNPLSSGARLSLWLIPVMAVGLGVALHRVRALVERQAVLRWGFDLLVVGAAVVVLVAGYHRPIAYPFPGSASATEYVEASLRPGDVVLVANNGIFSFTVASKLPVTVVPTPDRQVGWYPRFADVRIQTVGVFGETPPSPAAIRAIVAGARRVMIYVAINGIGVGLNSFDAVLQSEGLRAGPVRNFDAAMVAIWQR